MQFGTLVHIFILYFSAAIEAVNTPFISEMKSSVIPILCIPKRMTHHLTVANVWEKVVLLKIFTRTCINLDDTKRITLSCLTYHRLSFENCLNVPSAMVSMLLLVINLLKHKQDQQQQSCTQFICLSQTSLFVISQELFSKYGDDSTLSSRSN